MKRVIALLLVCTLLLAAVPLPVFATPAPDLGALARLFPAETPIYAALGTSDGDIEALNAVLQVMARAMPNDFPPGVGVAELLDVVGLQLVGDSFSNSIRPWLGDSAALGILDASVFMAQAAGMSGSQAEPPLAIAFSVKDRAALDAFMEHLIIRNFRTDMFNITTEGAYTRYAPTMPGVDVEFLLSNEAFIFGPPAGIRMILAGTTSTLADSSAFTDALNLLPAGGYNLLFYVAAQPLMDSILTGMEAEGVNLMGLPPLPYTGVALGLTVLEGRAIALDIAEPIGDLTPELAASAMMYLPTAPLDMSFAVHFPADSLFTLMGSDFSAVVSALEMTTQLGIEQAMQQAMAAPGLQGEVPPDMAQGMADLEAMLADAEAQFTAATGLDLQADVLSWMTGQYGLAFRLDNDALMAAAPTSLPLGLGMVMEATDSAAIQRMMDRLLASAKTLQAEGMSVSQEVIGEGSALVLGFPQEVTADAGFPVEVLLGADSQVVALGTRDAVQAAMLRDGGLASDPRFVAAQAFMVENTTSVWYLNLAAIGPAILMQATPEEVANIQLVLRLLQSISLSGTTYDDGSSVARLVIALGG